MRSHILTLRQAHKKVEGQEAKEHLQKRIGKLVGRSATFWIGGVNQAVIDDKKTLAERTASALRAAVREGMVLGGGTALITCRPAQEKLTQESPTEEERATYRILLTALETPLRTIFHNAGYENAEHMLEINSVGHAKLDRHVASFRYIHQSKQYG